MKTRFLARVLTLVLLVGFLWSGWRVTPVRATTMVELSLDQLAQASSQIVRAHAIIQESHWNATHTQIVTLTTLAVEQTVKGAAQATVVVEQPGGTVGTYREYVPGTVRFYPITSYVLFLEPASAETSEATHYLIVGMTQGAYRIYVDPVTHAERVIRPMGGAYGASPALVKLTEATTALEQFQAQLHSLLRSPLVVPRGTLLPVAIVRSEPRGPGRLYVVGQTTTAIYPNANLVVPAGTVIEGEGTLVDGVWKIRWNSLSMRGRRASIAGKSELTDGESLRGMRLSLKVSGE